MPVFNLCLKIIKQNKTALSIYLGVFLAIVIILAGVTADDQKEINSFAITKENIAFISEEDTPLVKGLREELSKVGNFIDLPNEKEELQDALYFREVTSIIRIESGFTSKFLNGEEVSVAISNIPESYSAVYIQTAIDQYLNTAKLYRDLIEGITEEELVNYVKEDLSQNTRVTMLRTESVDVDTNFSVTYFNYLSYALLGILIMGIGIVMAVLNDKDIKMRNNSSPYSISRMNVQIILALFTFTLSTWLVMILFNLVLNFRNSLNTNTLYFMLNSLVFTFTATGISFLIGNAFKSKDAIGAISNVITLGTSFISGVFITQEYLGDFVLKIASFIPTYWYVRANNQIGSLSQFDFKSLESTLYSMVIQIGLGILFFILGIIVAKRNRVRV